MTASCGLYPSLGRNFQSLTELAHAGCMSRRRARDCLDGVKTFTRAEKKAIASHIIANELCKLAPDSREIADAKEAFKGRFDEIYKRKET